MGGLKHLKVMRYGVCVGLGSDCAEEMPKNESEIRIVYLITNGVSGSVYARWLKDLEARPKVSISRFGERACHDVFWFQLDRKN